MNKESLRIFFKDQLVSFLISPWAIALPVALIIIYFLPPIDKYKVALVKQGVSDKPDSFVRYVDLDKDGYGEKVVLFNNQKGEAATKILNQSDVMLNWSDFKGTIYKDIPASGDYDHDGKPEIYFISNVKDSLYLNILSISSDQRYIAKKRFITPVNVKDRKSDYNIYNWQFCDLQLDGIDEVMFSVSAGYSLQPRRLFAYDQKNDTVYAGPIMGCQITFDPVQLDDDPYIEFIGQSSSTGNMIGGTNIPFSDSSSWLMALDHKLNFIFNPVEFKGHPTEFICRSVYFNNNHYILGLSESSNVKPARPFLSLWDTQGRMIKHKELDKPGGNIFYDLLFYRFPHKERILIRNDKGEIFRINEELNLTKIAQFPEYSNSRFDSFDLDNDRAPEFIFMNLDCESVIITRNDFSHPVMIKLPFDRARHYLSRQENGNDNPFLFIDRGEREYWLSYGFNPLWYVKFPIWVAVYIFVLGFIHIIRKFQVIQQKKIKARESQLAELQLGKVSSYLDPHFTFNTLNTISSLIYKEDKNKAYEVLTGFSSLIRLTLLQSGKVSRTLGEELEFVKSYLDIQQFRFGNIFTWEITGDDKVDLTRQIPKMLIQNYAENAIKHGLKNKGAGGKLDIILTATDAETRIVIRDNGVGRKKANDFNEPGTGKGLFTMQQIFDLFQKTNKIQISQTINDLKDDSGNPSGTEVILTIHKTAAKHHK